MNVAMWCCHVRRKRRVGNVRLPNALLWLHGCCMSFVLGDSLGTKPCVFPCKVAPAGDERYLGCAAVAAAVVFVLFGSALLVWLQVALCVFVCRSYGVIWNLGLQIPVEGLHECCHVVLPCACREAGWRREVAKRIVMVAWMLHELFFGR